MWNTMKCLWRRQNNFTLAPKWEAVVMKMMNVMKILPLMTITTALPSTCSKSTREKDRRDAE
jgi:hypothetical protein